MVLIRPILCANHAAPKCESAFRTCTVKKSNASLLSAMPKRRKKQYEPNASLRKPPPKASIENSAESRLTVDFALGEIALPVSSGEPALRISTSGDNNKY